ncbi:MAG: YajQ family cyclic di-GMP-binding protein [Sandaracinaceae bacterium]|nr:YajQ family cyclic di-GMP-binding protein [Sandaracinaceae bacterium]
MASFDVVSKLDHHEVDNAIDQARREVVNRFDFKGTDTEIEKTEEGIVIRSTSDSRCVAALDVLQTKILRRGVSLKALDAEEPKPAGGKNFRQLIKLREGIETELAKKIVKLLKDSNLKVQGAIQGDVVRVSHKKRDVLQEAIALIKEQDYEAPLQFQNFRD